MLRARFLSPVTAVIALAVASLRPALEAQIAGGGAHVNSVAIVTGQFPLPESLYYSVEWRLWYAGNARVTLRPEQNQQWQSAVHLESAGMVSKLFTVNDNYTGQFDTTHFCAADTRLDAIEGKRHKLTTVRYDYRRDKASYNERDVQRNATIKTAETDIPSCASDIVGALLRLRTMHLEPGQSAQIPVSDGKKFVNVKVEAQERESIQTKLGSFKTIRYEAHIFNGVLYTKNARLLMWLSDDARRLPVQIRVRMPFVVGTITLTLDKEEHAENDVIKAAGTAPFQG